jgi:hypothetical protein
MGPAWRFRLPCSAAIRDDGVPDFAADVARSVRIPTQIRFPGIAQRDLNDMDRTFE